MGVTGRYDIRLDDETKIKYFRCSQGEYHFSVKRGGKTICFSHPYASIHDARRAAKYFYEHVMAARSYLQFGTV